GFDDAIAHRLLNRPHEYVRAWTVRFVGDDGKISLSMARRFVELAATEPSAVVRCQLAATAKRIPGKVTVEIVKQLLDRDVDRNDPYIPPLVGWALEDKALAESDWLIHFFATRPAWESDFVRSYTLKLMRRWAAEGSQAGYMACAKLLTSEPPQNVQR